MASRLKKVMQPILKQKCSEAYQKGLEDGWKRKCMVYERDIEFLKMLLKEKGVDVKRKN